MEREATVFTRYLMGRPATSRVCRRYGEALATLGLEAPGSAFDARLLAASGRHPLVVELLDSASAFLAADSQLRARLFVLAGLLETEPSYADRFLGPPPGRLGVASGLALRGTRTLVALLVGVPLLLVIRWTS